MRHWTTPLSIVTVLALWEIACRAFAIPAYILPTPSEIAVAAWDFGWGWLPSIYETLLTVGCGFGLALVVGFPLAVWIARSAVAYQAIYPLLVIKQSTPVVAIAPIIVVSFGTGLLAKALVAATVAIFPIVVSTATGLMATPKEYLELARSVHEDPWKALIRIRLPFAVRHIFSGLRVSITLAVIGAVVAEFVSAGRGLGYLVYSSTAFMRTSLAFAALLILGIVGLCLFALVGFIQNTAFPWAKEVPDGGDVDA
jgi:NitT/TauT family transport system permease protein